MLVIALFVAAALLVVAAAFLAFGLPAALGAAGVFLLLAALDLSRPSPGGPL